MNVKVNKKNGIRLKTKNKLLKEDIVITTGDELVQPEGNIEIKSTKEYNVANYETAQIVSDTLLPENIIEGVDILGVRGGNNAFEWVDLWKKHFVSGRQSYPQSKKFEEIFFKDMTELRDYAFAYSNWSMIILPDYITSIGDSAFRHMQYLSNFSLSDNITEIPDHCFYECSILYSIDIGEKITKIGEYAFYGCEKISKLILPASLNTIGKGAFNYVGNSEIAINCGVFFKGITPPANLPSGIFLSGVKRVFVPTGSLAAYQEAFVNSGFTGTWKEMDPEDMK